MHDFDVITGPTPAQRSSVCPVTPTALAPRPAVPGSRSQPHPRDEPAPGEVPARSPA